MNLDFSDKPDLARFKAKCLDQRKIAEKWPAYDANMTMINEYQWRAGPWHLVFYLAVWGKPMWHGSAAAMRTEWKTIPAGREAIIRTFGADLGQTIEIPVETVVETKDWIPEVREQARFILAEVFGPILRPNDNTQQARETLGAFALHWEIPFDGEPTWKKNQH